MVDVKKRAKISAPNGILLVVTADNEAVRIPNLTNDDWSACFTETCMIVLVANPVDGKVAVTLTDEELPLAQPWHRNPAIISVATAEMDTRPGFVRVEDVSGRVIAELKRNSPTTVVEALVDNLDGPKRLDLLVDLGLRFVK